MRPRLVLAAPAYPDVGNGLTVLSDFDDAANAAYELKGLPELVLIRPDGHIAFRSPAGRAGLLEQHCAKVLSSPGRSY